MSDDKTRISQRFAGADVGTQLSGIYELDARIATGGMGEVYRGHNIQTGDSVAIKIVLPEFAHDQTILSLFRKEASILNHLSHDAVVRYHVFTIDPGIGRPYLAMEFVDGESLFDVLRRGSMPADEVCKLCHRLTSGLAAVHEAGAIHRDLSPDNIILPGGRVERAKIVDFGIARSETVGGGTLIDGKFAGKYNYVSPEQLGLFGGQVSPQSDIYSLGLVLAAALRGKPIDMSGSQLDVVEKRRTVPDLSDIDMGFRPLLEAMLQPLPANRPPSMAEIAAMTRDGVVDIRGTRPPLAREEWQPGDDGWRSGEPSLPTTSQPPAFPAAGERSRPPGSAAGSGFVEHVRPSHLSAARPQAPPPSGETAPAGAGSRRTMGLVAAAASLLVVVGATGAYFGGFLGSSGQQTPASGASAALTPAPTSPEQPAPAPQASETASAAPNAPATAETPASAGSQPAPPASASAGSSAAERLAEALAQKPEGKVQNPAEPTQETAASPKPPVKPAGTEGNPANPDAARETSPEPVPAVPAAKPPLPAPAAKAAEAAPEPTPPPAEQSRQDDQPKPVEAQPQPATPPQPVETTAAPAPPPQDTQAATEPAQKNVAEAATSEQPVTPAPAATEADAGAPPSGGAAAPSASGSEQIVAMNIPKPVSPAGDAIDTVAQRISWLRAYQGGNCFYASAIAATDKSIEIEGFGTAVEPFAQLESAFEAKFQLEPEIDVRLIEPGQCQVANFLGSLSAGKAEKPELVLDRTSIPDGSALSGTLRTEPGLKSAMLLIDHKGMMFNLDDRVVVTGHQASFNIPIGLGAADKSLGKPVPQIVLVVTGPRPLQAAEVSAPVRAEEALPRILSEIRQGGGEFSATAKYFRLGG